MMFDSFSNQKILVLGAHPDDEMACAGFMVRLSDMGAEIHHHYFSTCAISTQDRGYEPDQLLQECEQSRNILGVSVAGRTASDFPVRNFPKHRQGILDALILLRADVNPDLILTSATSDCHQDHATVTQEVMRAFKHKSIWGYEMPWNMFRQDYDCLVSITSAQLDRKIASLASYKSQDGSPYVDPDFIRSLARVRGVQAGCMYAEAYQNIRMILR
jgi:N-acetylglucosamine malate deacetylase 1